MCERLTSHLFKLDSGPVIHTVNSHSDTRSALSIGNMDERYVEVEWRENSPTIEIRFPDSWGDSQREHALEWYAKHTPMREDLISYCLNGGSVIAIQNEDIGFLSSELPNCRTLSCDRCTGLTTLPDLPNCLTLSCDRCTGLTTLPDLPNLSLIHI